jgi:two-component system, NarL family, response regulator LiaR
LIADDHLVVRRGLKGFLSSEQDMEVAGEAADADGAIQQALAIRPDVILLDMMMPGKDGVAAIAEIKRQSPDARILVLTGFVEDEKVTAALKMGALGYILKGTPPMRLLEAVRDVARGETVLGPEVAARLVQGLNRPRVQASVHPAARLTEREMEVLRLLAQGRGNQEIARRMYLSERTARNHVSSILTKLNVESRTQAALVAVREGLPAGPA